MSVVTWLGLLLTGLMSLKKSNVYVVMVLMVQLEHEEMREMLLALMVTRMDRRIRARWSSPM